MVAAVPPPWLHQKPSPQSTPLTQSNAKPCAGTSQAHCELLTARKTFLLHGCSLPHTHTHSSEVTTARVQTPAVVSAKCVHETQQHQQTLFSCQHYPLLFALGKVVSCSFLTTSSLFPQMAEMSQMNTEKKCR